MWKKKPENLASTLSHIQICKESNLFISIYTVNKSNYERVVFTMFVTGLIV